MASHSLRDMLLHAHPGYSTSSSVNMHPSSYKMPTTRLPLRGMRYTNSQSNPCATSYVKYCRTTWTCPLRDPGYILTCSQSSSHCGSLLQHVPHGTSNPGQLKLLNTQHAGGFSYLATRIPAALWQCALHFTTNPFPPCTRTPDSLLSCVNILHFRKHILPHLMNYGPLLSSTTWRNFGGPVNPKVHPSPFACPKIKVMNSSTS